MKTKNVVRTGSRRDRLLKEHIHDPYKTTAKLAEPTICPACGAVYHGGRWQWLATPPAGAHRQTCQACRRTQDHYPAGEITLHGAFARSHRPELVNLVRHEEAEENAAHPLHRVIDVTEHPNRTVITTTDIHLPHRIAQALRHSYHGEVAVEYGREEHFVRVDWSREE